MVGRASRAWALLALLSAHAAAGATADGLWTALNRARTFTARGQVDVTVNFPPRAEPTRRAAQLPAVPFRPALLRRNFRVVLAGEEQVAGRVATRYDLTPGNPGASRWTVWVDVAWQVPLAFEERRPGGALARRASFLNVNATLAAVHRPLPSPPAGLRAAVLQALPGLQLPDDFTPVEVARQGGRWTVTLSDGVNVLALVIAPSGVRAAPGVVSRRVDGRFVWLVGALPQGDLSGALTDLRRLRPALLEPFVRPLP
ncbi:transcriptional regulator [Deinococcus sonorensis]|uniref:Transcriptional regulator n=2 Tax=Deinococcus sonorensis TaxID=309891 RepID=A0AAU7U5M2_9DEIO